MRALAARAENLLATLALGGIMLLPLAEIALARVLDDRHSGRRAVRAEPDALGRPARRGDRRAGRQAPDARHRRVPAQGHASAERRPRRSAGSSARRSPTMFAVGGAALVTTERAAGDIIAVGVPVWISTLVFPVAFWLIALRLVWRASPHWVGRAIAALGIVAGFLLAQHHEVLEGAAALAVDHRSSSSPACSARRSSRCSAASRCSRSSSTAAGRSCRSSRRMRS